MKQLTQTLRNAGFAVIECDGAIIAGHKEDKSLTMAEVLEVTYPQFQGLTFSSKNGLITITNNLPDTEKHHKVREWWQSLEPEERWMQIIYRYEDYHNDQQVALEQMRGD